MKKQLLTKLLESLIFLTIVCSPLYVIRWQYSVLPTTLLEHLIFLTFLSWLFYRLAKKDFSFPRTRIDHLIALLVLACVLSLYQTKDLRGGLGFFKAYFVEPVVMYYIIVDLIRKKVLTQKLVIWGMASASLWLSFLGIAQSGFDTLVISSHEAFWGRAHAVFNSANSLALFIGPVISLILGYQLVKDRQKDKVVKSIVFIILLGTMWLTKSTGGLLATVVVMLFYLSVQFLSWETLKKLSVFVLTTYLIGQLIFMALIGYLTPTVANPWERTGGTERIRFCVWEGTVNLLKENPILGAGLSGFKELYSTKYYTCDAEPLEYPHNVILNFWTEIGLIGLIAIVGILVAVFKSVLMNSSKRGVRWGILGGISYWLFHGLVDVPYFKNDLSLMFWLLMALWWFRIPVQAGK